nr:MAG TPA: hypothetical protein [Caudoviricetes sp.]
MYIFRSNSGSSTCLKGFSCLYMYISHFFDMI